MDADVAVVGTGTMGAMVAWQCAEAGLSTVAFERFGVGHDRSAAGGESRVFRTAYLEGPEYVPLLLRSRELWRELERQSGRDLLTLTGALMIGPDGSPQLANVLASAREFALEHEVLDAAALAGRYPQHRPAAGEMAVLDRAAGYLRPEFAVIAAARRAAALGAEIRPGSTVLEVAPEESGVRVRTAEREWRARTAVLTAGPWTARLAPRYAGLIRPQRLIMSWFAAEDPAAFGAGRFPVFIRELDGKHLFGVPTLDGGSVKVALSNPYGDVGEPELLDHEVPPGTLDVTLRAVRDRMTGLHPHPHRVSVHMDGYTPDLHPVVGPLPGAPNVLVLGGFSGHGFKMAPAFGRIARDLITRGDTDLPIAHLAPDRF